MVLDTFLLNIQHYKVRIKGKVSNPGKGVAHSLHFYVVAIEKGAFYLPITTTLILENQPCIGSILLIGLQNLTCRTYLNLVF